MREYSEKYIRSINFGLRYSLSRIQLNILRDIGCRVNFSYLTIEEINEWIIKLLDEQEKCDSSLNYCKYFGEYELYGKRAAEIEAIKGIIHILEELKHKMMEPLLLKIEEREQRYKEDVYNMILVKESLNRNYMEDNNENDIDYNYCLSEEEYKECFGEEVKLNEEV